MADTGNDSTQSLTLTDCVRKAQPPLNRYIALLRFFPLSTEPTELADKPSIQSKMFLTKQLKLLFQKKLSASVTYVGSIDPTEKCLLPFVLQCTQFKPKAVIMFGKIYFLCTLV